MRRKPWPIIILAYLHFMGPLGTIVFSAWLEKMSIVYYTRSLLHDANLSEWASVFLVTPIAGIAIFAVKAWSYPIFLAASLLTIGSNVDQWYHYSSILTFPWMITANFLDLVVVSYFLIPQVREAYFNRSLRWWEAKPRYNLNERCSIRGPEVKFEGWISNISEGGAFLVCGEPLDIGGTVSIRFKVDGEPTIVNARVVHHLGAKGGYGVEFQHAPATRKRIKEQIHSLAAKSGPKESRLKDFFHWLTLLLKSGKGLIPELPEKLGTSRPEKKAK